jgi:hypothetical protein
VGREVSVIVAVAGGSGVALGEESIHSRTTWVGGEAAGSRPPNWIAAQADKVRIRREHNNQV